MNDSYVAGLFDGEGYVRIDRWKKPGSLHTRYSVKTGLGMNYRPVIEKLHAEFGGYLGQNRHDLRGPNNRIQFTWELGSRGAVSMLRRILPFLIVKREQAEIAIELQDHIDAHKFKHPGRNWLRPERLSIIAYREELFQRITALKKESFPPLLIDGPKVSGSSLTR